MGEERITVTVGGKTYASFLRVEVSAAFNEAARSFQIECAHEGGPGVTAWTFGAGASVSIASNGSPMLKGYVDSYKPRVSARERTAIVSGRSKAADFVDSSAEHKTGEMRDKTVKDLAKELDKFGVGIKAEGALKAIKVMRITPGETAFRAVERYCRSQGLTLCGQADGSILIGKAGSKRHAGGLIEGVNLLEAEADHDWSGRHSDYKVKGQRPDGHGAPNLEIERMVRDSAVKRYRPVIVVVEEDTDDERAGERAKNRKERAAGASLRVTVTVQGFRDQGGTLWEPGHLVYVESPSLSIQQDMLIERAVWRQDEGGSLCTLSVVDPRAYGGKAGKGNKSGGAWDTGEK